MGPGNRLGNEASDLNRQVPRQRQWNSATQTKGELTTVADRPEADLVGQDTLALCLSSRRLLLAVYRALR